MAEIQSGKPAAPGPEIRPAPSLVDVLRDSKEIVAAIAAIVALTAGAVAYFAKASELAGVQQQLRCVSNKLTLAELAASQQQHVADIRNATTLNTSEAERAQESYGRLEQGSPDARTALREQNDLKAYRVGLDDLLAKASAELKLTRDQLTNLKCDGS